MCTHGIYINCRTWLTIFCVAYNHTHSIEKEISYTNHTQWAADDEEEKEEEEEQSAKEKSKGMAFSFELLLASIENSTNLNTKNGLENKLILQIYVMDWFRIVFNITSEKKLRFFLYSKLWFLSLQLIWKSFVWLFSFSRLIDIPISHTHTTRYSFSISFFFL